MKTKEKLLVALMVLVFLLVVYLTDDGILAGMASVAAICLYDYIEQQDKIVSSTIKINNNG